MIFQLTLVSNILLERIWVTQLIFFLKSELDLLLDPDGDFFYWKKCSYYESERYALFCETCHILYWYTYMPSQLNIYSYTSYILATL